MDPDSEVIDLDSGVDSDHDESEDDVTGEASTSGDVLFSAPQQVFIVRALSKAIIGFRPSVMCEGYLAMLSESSAGYILAPLGQDQQLSFKYEPPSPKFSRKRPSCLSYRLQLLHGSQFLYSLRGLPKVLRCQRAAQALEWGPVHLVFAAAADLDTFLATLKYVEVEEMTPEAEDGQQSGGGTAEEAPRPAAATAPASVGRDGGGGGADGQGREPSIGGAGMQWATATARLLAAQRSANDADGFADVAAAAGVAAEAEAGVAATAAAGVATAAAAEAAAAAAEAGVATAAEAAGVAADERAEAQPDTDRPDLHGFGRALPLGIPLLAAGTVVLVVAVVAAFLLGASPGRLGRKTSA